MRLSIGLQSKMHMLYILQSKVARCIAWSSLDHGIDSSSPARRARWSAQLGEDAPPGKLSSVVSARQLRVPDTWVGGVIGVIYMHHISWVSYAARS